MLNALALTLALVASPAWVSFTIKDSLEASIVRVVPAEGPALSAEVARLLALARRCEPQCPQRRHPPAALSGRGDRARSCWRWCFVGAQINLHAYRYAGADQHPTLLRRTWRSGGAAAAQRPGAHLRADHRNGAGRARQAPAPRHRSESRRGLAHPLPFSGTVLRTNWSQRVNGHCIEVAFDNGKVGRFLHLQRLDSEVRAGAHLAVDAPLGLVGNTGHSNAAHLHYEILVAGKPVEPLDVHADAPSGSARRPWWPFPASATPWIAP